MNLWVGTSGFSYKEWRGSFYPEKLPPGDMLRYYAEQLPAVEINNTFYRMPRAEVLASWSDQVPDGFRFSIKASQRITHKKRLKEAKEEASFLFGNLETLGDRLGVVLFQLPPYLRKDLPRLETFLDYLPEGARAAFEFRHDSWFGDDLYATLQDRDCALCCADTEDGLEIPLLDTTWGYLRLRRLGYRQQDLATWAHRVREKGWTEAFVFFKHEDEGAGPALAARFGRLLGGVPPSDTAE
jgi:uncharacterized protein YecE (DUF72 family)